MKKLIGLFLCLILLAGCGAGRPVLEDEEPMIDDGMSEAAETPETPEIPVNNVLQIVMGSEQWEGIIVNIGEDGIPLDESKEYEFSFRLYTPNENVGIVFQANTHNGWGWDTVIEKRAEELQPEGWHEASGRLNLAREGVTGLPRLVLVRNIIAGFDKSVTFWIDDFKVVDIETDEVVFRDDFEGRTTPAPFRENGGSVSIVREEKIFEVPEDFSSRGQHALDVPSLKEIYAEHFLIGNIINPRDFNDRDTSAERYEILKHHYNVLTFENFMKPDSMWGPGHVYEQPSVERAHERLHELDGYISRLLDDGFKVVGHTLVWHGQSPNWLNLSAGNREISEGDNAAVYKPYAEARANLELFINTIAGHYYNHPEGLNLYAWDVINEAVRRYTGVLITEENWGWHTAGAIWVPQGPQWNSPWFECYRTDPPDGVNPWDYVYDAYILARKADPTAILYYNDFNMEVPEKVIMVVNMVNAVNLMWANDAVNNSQAGSYTDVKDYINAGGRLLIERIGMQQHDNINSDIFRTEAAILAYAATGVKVSITELDVGVPGYNNQDNHLSRDDEILQAFYYARLFEVLLRHSEHIERVSFWGLCDGRNWRRGELPLLFTPDLRTKLAYYAVADPIGFLASPPSFIEKYMD